MCSILVVILCGFFILALMGASDTFFKFILIVIITSPLWGLAIQKFLEAAAIHN